ncbi:DUF4124 domain-containing protein [Rhabdochromatium marinum]|uniref:DUF4124 domain-containing protein n=1 Tax=Rhabdochromatium marinum TaxID=48729 RepID=UPI0019044E68|nr:DUF4124 domain-containing protein [Rhabdochromatium marinum]
MAPRRLRLPLPLPLLLGLLLALGGLVLPLSAAAQQLYRWVDDDGKVHFSDRLPPAATDKARVELSKEGVPLRTVDRAKTRDEWLQEQELERLRKEQQALIDQQRNEDQVLLRSYRTADDLIMMRDGKIAAVDVMIQQLKGNIRRLQNRINRLQSDAAELERAGKPVYPQLERNIAATKENIQSDLAVILRHERTKQGIYEQFAEDMERFRRLKNVRELVQKEDKRNILLGLDNLVPCANDRECDLLWGQAVGYVEANATQPIESLSDTVVITAAPQDEGDISLIVSRIPNDPKHPEANAVLFLDLQCLSYLQAASACRTDQRLEVLEGFRTALLGDQADGDPANADEAKAAEPVASSDQADEPAATTQGAE